jgi:hypothetical protein
VHLAHRKRIVRRYEDLCPSGARGVTLRHVNFPVDVHWESRSIAPRLAVGLPLQGENAVTLRFRDGPERRRP